MTRCRICGGVEVLFDAGVACRCTLAIATEAHRAETPQSGSVHESAAPQEDAQTQSPSQETHP